MTTSILFLVFQVVAVPTFSPLMIGIIRKMKARLQGRVGADIFQPYRDLRKLFSKDEVISSDASWITRFAPYVIFSITLLLGATVPLVTAIAPMIPGRPDLLLTATGDFLVIAYLFALMTFFLALAGMDAGSGFGGFGSSREMMVAALAEAGLIFSLLPASFLAGTGHILDMIGQLENLPMTSAFPLFVAFLAFLIALLAENARFPVDNPATHLELTMIHEAMLLEYSGKRLALMEWAGANKLMIFIALAVNIFFPWGVAFEFSSLQSLAVPVLIFSVKSLGLLMLIALIESLMAKFRIFRVPDLLFTSFVLGMIAVVLTVSLTV
ncbi:MAG: formate hydrogenlyase [Candidatus Moraniibacteriota bacterium]|nr:MAG: formate hydrogenlyase [Candidatus Moranbacteria bacterium]